MIAQKLIYDDNSLSTTWTSKKFQKESGVKFMDLWHGAPNGA